MQESPFISNESREHQMTVITHSDIRVLLSQLSLLRIENEGLRHQLDRDRDQRMPAELKWLIYFRVPAQEEARASKKRVLAIVREGLVALLAKDPSFRTRECATSWAAQEHSNWQAFRIDYVGYKLVAFRAAMKAAHADAQVPANDVRTTQPSSVTLYRQLPEVPPLFTGTLEELVTALRLFIP